MKQLPVAKVGRKEDDALALLKGLFYPVEPLELDKPVHVVPFQPGHPVELEEHHPEVFKKPPYKALPFGRGKALPKSPLEVFQGGPPVPLEKTAGSGACKRPEAVSDQARDVPQNK